MFSSQLYTSMDTSNIFILSGPTGSGKDSIIQQLQQRLPLERIVNTTTRSKRPGESEGHPYYFVTREAFDISAQQGLFIEHSINENGACYGVSITELHRVVNQNNRIGLWQADWKGVQSIKKLFPGIPAIFISSSLDTLEKRIRSRDTLKDESYFLERMNYTKEWLKHTDIYDYIVENEQGKLAKAVSAVEQIIRDRTSIPSL